MAGAVVMAAPLSWQGMFLTSSPVYCPYSHTSEVSRFSVIPSLCFLPHHLKGATHEKYVPVFLYNFFCCLYEMMFKTNCLVKNE